MSCMDLVLLTDTLRAILLLLLDTRVHDVLDIWNDDVYYLQDTSIPCAKSPSLSIIGRICLFPQDPNSPKQAVEHQNIKPPAHSKSQTTTLPPRSLP